MNNTINSFMDSDSSSDSTPLDNMKNKPLEIDTENKSPEKEHSASLNSPPMSPILLKSTTKPSADENAEESSSDDCYLFYSRDQPLRKTDGIDKSIEDGKLLYIHSIMCRSIRYRYCTRKLI